MGMQLVSIQSKEENDFIAKQIQSMWNNFKMLKKQFWSTEDSVPKATPEAPRTKISIFLNYLWLSDSTTYWTSGTDSGWSKFTFNWMGSGQSLTFKNWYSGYPAGDDFSCIVFTTNALGQWANYNCTSNSWRYVCENRLSDWANCESAT